MTHAALNDQFKKIEQQRNSLLDKLKIYDDKVLNQRPGENRWSVMEVINHLTIAEDFSYQYLAKKITDPASTRPVGLKESFRSLLLNAYLASPKKFDAPAVALPTGTYTSLQDGRLAWSTVRENIHGIWTALPEGLLDRNWFKHPVAGKLSLMHMLTFMKAHAKRHEKQIWRTLREVSK